MEIRYDRRISTCHTTAWEHSIPMLEAKSPSRQLARSGVAAFFRSIRGLGIIARWVRHELRGGDSQVWNNEFPFGTSLISLALLCRNCLIAGVAYASI